MTTDAAASVKARLLRQAKASGEEFERTLTRFAAERLLYRLGASPARTRCLLKGASLLAVWLPDPYRATRDVDVLLSGQADEATIRSLVEEICTVPCPADALSFDLSQLVVETIRPEDERVGKRARFRAHLDKARIAVQLDVGVGDVLTKQPEEIVYPTMLANLPPPRLLAYPREATIAEKFEAMVQLDTRNSRMKDFHDLWALAGAFGFDGSSLQVAITACLKRRGTTWTGEPPGVLTPAFYQRPDLTKRWQSYLAARTNLIQPPPCFEEIGKRVIALLSPIRNSAVAGKLFAAVWPPGGPWEVPSTSDV